MIVYHGGVSEIRHPDLAQGLYGIDNLDYKYLVEDLVENEPELF